MGKFYGYTMEKIEKKAEKRGMTPQQYLDYLKMRSNGMIVFPVEKEVTNVQS